MSYTDLDASTLARSLRRMAGDGSMEWVMEPMQSRVLLDMADLLDENAKLRDQLEEQKCFAADLERDVRALRELVRDMFSYASNREMELCNACVKADGEFSDCAACDEYDGACGIAKKRFEELYSDRMRELEVEVGE